MFRSWTQARVSIRLTVYGRPCRAALRYIHRIRDVFKYSRTLIRTCVADEFSKSDLYLPRPIYRRYKRAFITQHTAERSEGFNFASRFAHVYTQIMSPARAASSHPYRKRRWSVTGELRQTAKDIYNSGYECGERRWNRGGRAEAGGNNAEQSVGGKEEEGTEDKLGIKGNRSAKKGGKGKSGERGYRTKRKRARCRRKDKEERERERAGKAPFGRSKCV